MILPSDDVVFLPGVPAAYVRERLEKADGHELTSGKLASKESSAALAVNTFGWFHDRPERLPIFPTLRQPDTRAQTVEIEYCARFPWSGGRHPWLDAFIETPTCIIGVESKRFEPYRGRKKDKSFSRAYDRPVWHDRMVAYERLRDKLRSGEEQFRILDALQLMKHAFGMVTEGRRKAKRPYLVYLFAEPTELGGRLIEDGTKKAHRDEIARFDARVSGAEVGFGATSYREWLSSWPDSDQELVRHRLEIISHFHP